MWGADETLIINQLGPYMHGHNKQSGRSGLGLSNFMQTKHAHEHFDLTRSLHEDIPRAGLRSKGTLRRFYYFNSFQECRNLVLSFIPVGAT